VNAQTWYGREATYSREPSAKDLLFSWWAQMGSNYRPHGYQKWCTRGARWLSDLCNTSTRGFVLVGATAASSPLDLRIRLVAAKPDTFYEVDARG